MSEEKKVVRNPAFYAMMEQGYFNSTIKKHKNFSSLACANCSSGNWILPSTNKPGCFCKVTNLWSWMVGSPEFPILMRYPIDRADAGRGGRRVVTGDWHALHETEVRYTLNDINRISDNYLESVRSDVAERLIEKAATGEADWQLIRSRMNGHQLLKSLQHSHGLDTAKYSVTKSSNGEDRIRCGSRSYSVNDFLTKELNLNWQEAGEYLKLEYARQIRKEVTNDFVAPSRSYWHQFKE
ncbi:hypothetical protein JJQ04_23380, partial [Enterobacter hormaechei]|nr:hypothetical protein [Enterobacter hormaechei]